MTTPAVAERPVGTPATQGAPADTQDNALVVTDGKGSALPTGQAAATDAGEGAGGAPDAGAEDDDAPRYSAKTLAAEKAAAKEAARIELEEEQAIAARESSRSKGKDDLSGHFRTHAAEQRRRLAAAGLGAEEIASVMAPIDAMNLRQEEAIFATVGAEYHNETERLLSKLKIDSKAFWADAPDALDAAALLERVSEATALKTKAFKAAKPEDLIAAHSGLKAHVAKAIEEAIDEHKKGNRPASQPGRGDGAPGASMDYASLETAYGNGTATKAQEAEYLKQKAARAKK